MQVLLDKVLLSNVLPTTIELGFLIALSLFPGTEKGAFDYVCIVLSFKSSTVLNCAANGLREALILRQLRKMNNKQEEGAQLDTYMYHEIYFMFSKANKVRGVSQPNDPF